MGLIKTIKFSDFALDSKMGLKDYSLLYIKNGVSLKNLLIDENIEFSIKSGRTPSKFNEDYWHGEYDFFTMQDIDQNTYILNDISSEKITAYAINNEKTLYLAPPNSLIVSNAMTIGLAFIAQRKIYINQNVFHINIDEKKANKIFIKWYFNLIIRPKFLKIFTSKYFSKNEFGRLKIPNISLFLQNQVIEKVEPIEKEIQDLKAQKKEPLAIINDIFTKELKFDWNKFNTIKKEKIFTSNLLEFSNNKDTRFSYKFHNRENKYLYEFLESKTNKKVKNFINEPIVLGKSITPSLYDKDGEHYYIAMSNIKNYRFDTEGCKKVGIKYFTDNKNKSIQLNDILLARSGEGTIGKVAIIEDEEVEGIFADFTMRIRLTNYNKFFAYYYFRSDFFQYLVYTHKKGLGNNTNIFPSQIQEFPLLDYDLEYQQKIVDKIQTKINSQKDIDEHIKSKQDEISKIIEDCIKAN